MSSIANTSVFKRECDLVIIPISTNGTISASFYNGLLEEFPAFDFRQRKLRLGDVVIDKRQSRGGKCIIAFACTVDNYKSNYASIRKVGRELAVKVKDLNEIQSIATPILGTGAGGLDPFQSMNIMHNAFFESGISKSKSLIFCTPERSLFQQLERRDLDYHTPSGQLALVAEIGKIRQNEIVEKIQSDKEFYFELAELKFTEFIDFKPDSQAIYTEIQTEFHKSSMSFGEYLSSILEGGDKHKFVLLCGELITYMDHRAYRKHMWNKYEDKRVLARSAVRQQNWFINLVKYKVEGAKAISAKSIANGLKYLKDPSRNLTMLSENHRQMVCKEILGINVAKNKSEAILSMFSDLGFESRNYKNFGVLCSRILYLPFIKAIWDESSGEQDTRTEVLIQESQNIENANILIEQCVANQSTTLDLGNCGIYDLSIFPELFNCVHLHELILSNEWPIYEDGKWRQIRTKNFGAPNRISAIPRDIEKLVNLRELICGGDWSNGGADWNRWGITKLGPIIKLTKLEYLNVSNNALSNLNGLSKLRKLKTLHLNNNKIKKVEDLSNLSELAEVFLSNNKIQDVSFLKGLSSVKTIDLHNNHITDLRPIKNIIKSLDIINDKWKPGSLNIAKNPLEQPPMEMVNIGRDAVLRTLEDVEERGAYVNKDVKVILVGNSEVGKSTMAKYLDNEKGLTENHISTLWMEEMTVTSKYKVGSILSDCTLHLFDFGGHDYYHDTHHLFYGSNAIYLLLWEEKTNNLNLRKCIQENRAGEQIEVETQDYPVAYWLDSVKYHIKDIEADNIESSFERVNTYNSSLLLIQNKVSESLGIRHLNNEKILSEYPFIHDIINVEIKNSRRNMAHFDSCLQEILGNMRIVGAILPSYYADVKSRLLSYNGPPIISVDDFQAYCNSFLTQPIDLSQSEILIRYLQQIGLLLYHKGLRADKVYIDKNWVLNSIHSVLQDLHKQGGEFNKAYVDSSLGAEKKEFADDVLQMMMDFQMIFRHPFKPTFIAPLYLPKMPESKIKLFINEKNIAYRRFEYSGFIQKNVILRIFQHYSSLLTTGWSNPNDESFYYWKDGLIIKKPGTSEIVMIKFHLGREAGQACIDVYDLSAQVNTSGFVLEVVQYVAEVNKGYSLEEMVTLDGSEFISKQVLDRNAELGKYVFSERKLADFGNMKQEDKVFNLRDYKGFVSAKIKKKKVVISYSKHDLDHVLTLERYLQPLVDAELIDNPWYCTLLPAGDSWDITIKNKFDEADIVFFMISEYFFATKYILEHEIPNAINRYDDGYPVKIIPIVLEFYDWGRKPPYNLQRFSALPFQAKPMSDFSNPKIAWNAITSSVRLMIERDLDPGKSEMISKELKGIYERQVKGHLDRNEH